MGAEVSTHSSTASSSSGARKASSASSPPPGGGGRAGPIVDRAPPPSPPGVVGGGGGGDRRGRRRSRTRSTASASPTPPGSPSSPSGGGGGDGHGRKGGGWLRLRRDEGPMTSESVEVVADPSAAEGMVPPSTPPPPPSPPRTPRTPQTPTGGHPSVLSSSVTFDTDGGITYGTGTEGEDGDNRPSSPPGAGHPPPRPYGPPVMARPTMMTSSSPMQQQPVCWGWIPGPLRAVSERSAVPAVSVVSDESGGSRSSQGDWSGASELRLSVLEFDGGRRGSSRKNQNQISKFDQILAEGDSDGVHRCNFEDGPASGSGQGPPRHLPALDHEASPPLPPPPPLPLLGSDPHRDQPPPERAAMEAMFQARREAKTMAKTETETENEPKICLPVTCGACHVLDLEAAREFGRVAGGLAGRMWGEGSTDGDAEAEAAAAAERDGGTETEAATPAPARGDGATPDCRPPFDPPGLELTDSARRERDELLEEAAQREAEGDHASALECYERCLTVHHHYQAPSAGRGEESRGGGGGGGGVIVVQPGASLEVADILHKIGVVHWKAGQYDESLSVLRESLAVHRRHFVPRPDLTLSVWDEGTRREFRHNPHADAFAGVLNSVGRVHLSRGEYASAMRHYQESLAVQDAVYSDASLRGHPLTDDDDMTTDTANTGLTSGRSRLSRSSRKSGRSSIRSQSSKAAWRSLPPHPGIARTTIAIGMVFDARGQPKKAMRRYRAGLRSQRSCLGDSHVDVAATLNSIGTAYEKSGRYDKAMECYSEALWIYRSRLGNAHVDVAVTLNNVGQVHHHWAEYDEAMAAYVEALRIMRRVLGDSHRNVAASLHNVGLVHSARGRYDKSLKIFREVLKSQRSALGDSHPDVAVSLDSIGEAYEGKGRYDRALKFYSKALQVRRSALGRRHPFVAVTLDRIGRFHVERDGNQDEAERRLGEAREVYLCHAGAAGEDDPRVREVDRYLESARMMQSSSSSGRALLGSGGEEARCEALSAGKAAPEWERESHPHPHPLLG